MHFGGSPWGQPHECVAERCFFVFCTGWRYACADGREYTCAALFLQELL